MEYSGGTLHHGSNDYMSNVPGKSYSFFPKYTCDTSRGEVAKVLKVENNKIVQISFT